MRSLVMLCLLVMLCQGCGGGGGGVVQPPVNSGTETPLPVATRMGDTLLTIGVNISDGTRTVHTDAARNYSDFREFFTLKPEGTLQISFSPFVTRFVRTGNTFAGPNTARDVVIKMKLPQEVKADGPVNLVKGRFPDLTREPLTLQQLVDGVRIGDITFDRNGDSILGTDEMPSVEVRGIVVSAPIIGHLRLQLESSNFPPHGIDVDL